VNTAVDNDVFGNVITDNACGSIKVMDAGPHGRICGNRLENDVGGAAVGDFAELVADAAAAPC
jgi:hypothetical protein